MSETKREPNIYFQLTNQSIVTFPEKITWKQSFKLTIAGIVVTFFSELVYFFYFSMVFLFFGSLLFINAASRFPNTNVDPISLIIILILLILTLIIVIFAFITPFAILIRMTCAYDIKWRLAYKRSIFSLLLYTLIGVFLIFFNLYSGVPSNNDFFAYSIFLFGLAILLFGGFFFSVLYVNTSNLEQTIIGTYQAFRYTLFWGCLSIIIGYIAINLNSNLLAGLAIIITIFGACASLTKVTYEKSYLQLKNKENT